MSETNRAATERPVHELIARRWSPYAFAERAVPAEDLASLFEAARWAPSSYNEQPWAFLLARREEGEAFEAMLSCLVDANREWARSAAALVVAAVRTTFARSGRENPHAAHDLGLASANLVLEATARGLAVHFMAGILPERIRELYALPEGVEPMTMLAVGYAGSAAGGPYAERDAERRGRRPTRAFVFGRSWGRPADLP